VQAAAFNLARTPWTCLLACLLACFLACVGERAVLGGLFRDLRFLSRASFLVSRNYLLHTMCILSVCLSVCLISQPKLGKEVRCLAALQE